MTLPKLHTLEDVLGMWPEDYRPGERLLKEKAKEFECCLVVGNTITFTDEDVAALLEVFRKCRSNSNVGRRGPRSSTSVAPSADKEFLRALERTRKPSK